VDIAGREESTNVEDRRGLGTGGKMAVGGVGGVLLLLVSMFLGVDPRAFMGGGNQQPGDAPYQARDPEEEKQAHFVKVVFHDTEEVWGDLFKKMGRSYEQPVLVLFSGQVESACGRADASVGPFYCPGDNKVYIDLSFYRDMERKLKAPGEFARAYVIAHEVGHHVQKLLGYSRQAEAASRSMPERDRHQMSVRLELQADYLAGVWAHHGQERFHFMQKGDIESAINAAYRIGDDLLQKEARGRVVPDSFTHGTSKQRTYWFKKGFDTGDVRAANQLFTIAYDDL